MGDPEDDRGQRRGDIPVCEVERQQAPDLDVHLLVDVESGKPVSLQGGEDAKKSCGAEHQSCRRRPGFLH